jgi:hypothetical protein
MCNDLVCAIAEMTDKKKADVSEMVGIDED